MPSILPARLAALAVVGIAFLLIPMSAAPAMKVSVFLQKADALRAQGPLAMFSSDLELLRGEVRAAVAGLRAETAAARRAGRRPAFCLPPPGQAELGMDELLSHLRAIPRARQARTELRDALRPLAARRYPCRR